MTTVKAGLVYSIMNHRRENGLLTGSKGPLLLSASNTVSNTAALGWKGTRDRRIDPGSLVGQNGQTWSRGPLSLSLSFVLCLYENTLSPALLPWWLLFIYLFFFFFFFLKNCRERFVLLKQHLHERCNTRHVESKVVNDW